MIVITLRDTFDILNSIIPIIFWKFDIMIDRRYNK